MKKVAPDLFALLLFSIAAIWFTWPLCANLEGSYISPKEQSDANQYFWNAWNFSKQLKAGLNPFSTHHLVIGQPLNLWMHTYTPLMSLWCMLFDDITTGINIYLLLNFIIAALGARRLALLQGIQESGALLVGLLFAFAPIKFLHLPQHYHLMLQATAPWFLVQLHYLFLSSSVKTNTVKRYLWAGLLWFATFLSDYYTAAFLLYFSACIVLILRSKNLFSGAQRKKFVFGLILIAILLIGGVYFLNGKVDDKAGLWWGADLISLILPDETTLFPDRSTITSIIPGASGLLTTYEHQVFLGWTFIMLLGIYIFLTIKNSLSWNIWLSLATISLLVSMPIIKISGHFISYSPAAIAHFIPFFNNIRCPTRILTLFPLLAATGILLSIRNLKKVKNINYIYIILIASTFITLKTKPLPLVYKKDIPTVIQKIKEAPGRTVLPIPTGITDGMKALGRFNVNHLYWQTFHEKKILGAYIARAPETAFENYKRDPLMRVICELSEKKRMDRSKILTTSFYPDLIFIERKKVNESEVMHCIKSLIHKELYRDSHYILLQTKKAEG